MIPVRFAFPYLVLTPVYIIVFDLFVDMMELLLNEVIIVRSALPVLLRSVRGATELGPPAPQTTRPASTPQSR